MPQRDSAPIGAPCWVDLFTSDPERCQAFYGELFGWTAGEAGEEYGGYVNFSKDGLPIAGCMKNDGQSGPDQWSVYLATEDAKATADAAVANGGQVVVPPMEVMDLGSMAVLADAGGAGIGVWQPGQHKGFAILGEPGTPNWFELHTRDYEASVAFYREVFKWDTHVASDVPEFRYTTLGEGDGQLAGIMDASAFLPDGVAAHWSIYFGVDDTDAALAKITDLGGSVTRPAEDTPFGRLAQAADPTPAPPSSSWPAPESLDGSGMVSGMASKKVTITLDETKVERIRTLVAAGMAPSVSGFVQHAVDVSLDDVAGWGALLAEALGETGGALSDEERAWADEVLGVKEEAKKSVA